MYVDHRSRNPLDSNSSQGTIRRASPNSQAIHSNPNVFILTCIDGDSGSSALHVSARRSKRGEPLDHHLSMWLHHFHVTHTYTDNLAGLPFNRLSGKLRKTLAHLPYLPMAAILVWRAARGWTCAWAILLALQGILPALIVFLSRPAVDNLIQLVRTRADWRHAGPALMPAIGIGAAFVAMEILRVAGKYVRTVQSELVRDHVSGLIHAKSVEVDLSFYDWPEFYDHLHRAKGEAYYRPQTLIENLGVLAQSSISLASIAFLMLPYGAWLGLPIAGGAFPAFCVLLYFTNRQHQWRRKNTMDERRAWYYESVLTTGEAAAEIRLLDLGPGLAALYQTIRKRMHGEQFRLAAHQGLAELAAGVLALSAAATVVVYMLWRTILGLASPGDLALSYQAFQQGLGLMRTLMNNIGNLYADLLFLGNLFEFLELQPMVTDGAHPQSAPSDLSVAFEGVSFRYPGSARWALRDFNFALPAGKMVAIVGPNGSGKSTLVKLLARLYDPTEGIVAMGGVDLRQLSLGALRRQISTLFQQPLHYSATVAENLALGAADRTADIDVLRTAMREAGAEAVVERLPHELDTLLGRAFSDEGTELSQGEWQRIALARAILRDAPILILDEPTSAMDPWAEAEWLERFRKFASGKTVLIITHRFTTAMYADVIHVMERGKIVESGSHDELVRQGGAYADAWTKQRQA